jgi:hypothetical protein
LRYGLGNNRTFEQAFEFTGINLRERKMDVNKCGNLLWVPYKESKNYGIEEFLEQSSYAREVILQMFQKFLYCMEEVIQNQKHRYWQILVHAGSETRSGVPNYRLAGGGLICAVLALVIRMSTMRRKKDEKHKN